MNGADRPKCPRHPHRMIYIEEVEVWACTECGFDTWWSEDDNDWVTLDLKKDN